MAAYHDNSAYAFDMFETRERVVPRNNTRTAAAPDVRKEPAVLKKVPERSERYKRNLEISATKTMVMMLTLALFSFSMICMHVTAGAQRYELTKQIESVEKDLAAARSEQVRLNAELNSLTSITKIDSFATGILGMTKLENYQVEYVDLSDGDRVLFSKSPVLNFAKLDSAD
mgnify:CR=1 FL=1